MFNQSITSPTPHMTCSDASLLDPYFSSGDLLRFEQPDPESENEVKHLNLWFAQFRSSINQVPYPASSITLISSNAAPFELIKFPTKREVSSQDISDSFSYIRSPGPKKTYQGNKIKITSIKRGIPKQLNMDDYDVE